MSFEQVQEQQKAKSAEVVASSVGMTDLVQDLSSNGESGGGTGDFITDLTAALTAYSSGKKTVGSLNDQIASMPEIKDPEFKERKGLGKFFYKLFHGKAYKAEQAAKEDAVKQRAEREQKIAELQEQIKAQQASMEDALTQYSTLMSSATPEDKKKIVSNKVLINSIMADLPEANVKSSMDALYNEVGESDLDLMMDMIQARFGVPVTDGTEARNNKVPENRRNLLHVNVRKPDGTIERQDCKPWTMAALKKIYNIYLILPENDVRKLEVLCHFSDSSAGGAAIGPYGYNEINYTKGYEDRVERYSSYNDGSGIVSGHVDSTKDTRVGLDMMNMTIAHELGHVVDGKHDDYGYSKSDDFRKHSKWVQVDNDPKKVVQYMKESMSSVYDDKLTADEMAKATAVGEALVKNGPKLSGWSSAESFTRTELKKDETLDEEGREALAKKLLDPAANVNLLFHLWQGLADSMSCYSHTSAMKGMKRPFHQGYNNEPWFSFDNSKWSDKISCYQYRCPKEEFAETYASYHVSPTVKKADGTYCKKGEKMPEGLRTWFEKEGLHKMDPSQVSGSSTVKDEKKAS